MQISAKHYLATVHSAVYGTRGAPATGGRVFGVNSPDKTRSQQTCRYGISRFTWTEK